MGSKAALPQNRPVLVGVDGSRSTHATIDLAVAEAVRLSAPLLIVHVWPGRYTGAFRSRSGVPSPADGRRLLEVTAARARLAGCDLHVSTELVEGGAASVLTRWSERARLLVVGHCDGPFDGPSWGSTTAYLAHYSQCPLLVNRGGVHGGPVVVASSARSRESATLGYAFAEAASQGTRLVAVHMWSRAWAADGSAPPVAAGGYAAERHAAERDLADALDHWSPRFPGVPVERLVVSDLDLAYTIERASRRGRLLVAGIGRHGRFAELLYGSAGPGPVGLRSAPCPAVFVPDGWPIILPVPAEGAAGAGPR